MKKIVLPYKKPAEIMDIVREMRSAGMIQGTDFDFAYSHAQYNNDGWDQTSPAQTVFTFYEEKWATWFALRWV